MGQSSPEPDMSEAGQAAVATAGELLIRAVAAIAALSEADMQAISSKTEGKLPDCLLWALAGAGTISPAVRESLTTHPPKGVTISISRGVVDLRLPQTASLISTSSLAR